MLITYSLMITMLNQHWLRSKFRSVEVSDRLGTAKNARIFLQECQQLPLRLSQEEGVLASLVVLPDNAEWWKKLRESIQLTRRGVTLSLVAQIIVAILSWLLTVMSAFRSALGNPSEALVMSSGTLWVWLVSCMFNLLLVRADQNIGAGGLWLDCRRYTARLWYDCPCAKERHDQHCRHGPLAPTRL